MDDTSKGRLDLDAVRERLRTKRGPEFWRSLDELAETTEFQDLLHREFPRHASEWTDDKDGVSRRGFLQLAGASLTLAGLTACTKQPTEEIVPYVKQPEQLIPGKPLFFATALTVGGYATGVLAESHQGRPTKIEGNPDHPASLGATDVFAQAAVLSLYDPERSQTILHAGRAATWGSFVSEASAALRALQPQGGEGLRLLTGTVTSPTLAAQIQGLLQKYPEKSLQIYNKGISGNKVFQLAERWDADCLDLKPTVYGCSGVRTKFRIKPINVKADMYFLRKPANDLICDLFPCLTIIQPPFDVLVKIRNNAFVTVINDFKFMATVITHADLHKRF